MASQTDTDEIAQLEGKIADLQAQLAELKEKSNPRKPKKGSKVKGREIGMNDVKAGLAFIKLTGSVKAAKQALAVAQEIREMEPDPDEPAESEPTAEEELAEIDAEIAELREVHPNFDVVATATRKEKAPTQPEGPIAQGTSAAN